MKVFLDHIPLKYKDTFVAEVTFMFGDGDFYEHVEVVLGNQDRLVSFVDLLKNLPNRLEGSDKLPPIFFDFFSNRAPSFENVFQSELQAGQDMWSWENLWPEDKTCSNCGYAEEAGYKLFYYNAEGEKWSVRIVE